MCVSDAVEAPVLSVNSNSSSPDPCNFTCNGSNIIVSFIYDSSSCSPEEVTSSDNHTLRLSCSGDSIICNYSNPVSWKTDTKKVNDSAQLIKVRLPSDEGTENVWHWTGIPVGLDFSIMIF